MCCLASNVTVNHRQRKTGSVLSKKNYMKDCIRKVGGPTETVYKSDTHQNLRQHLSSADWAEMSSSFSDKRVKSEKLASVLKIMCMHPSFAELTATWGRATWAELARRATAYASARSDGPTCAYFLCVLLYNLHNKINSAAFKRFDC